MAAPVEIYTFRFCPYCTRAKELLDRKGVAYTEKPVALFLFWFLPSRNLREMKSRNPGADSVPQIFIGGRAVGGCDDLHALEASGELDRLLAG